MHIKYLIAMMNDKITPELKKRFKEEIKLTTNTGKERGLLLCNKSQQLMPTNSVTGDNFVNLKPLMHQCLFPSQIQGDFHTHSHMADVKKFVSKYYPKVKVSENEMRDMVVKAFKVKNIPVSGPSHGDLLGVLILKDNHQILGTVCSSSDAIPDKAECWTIKENINRKYYDRAKTEILNHNVINNSPHEWIKPLFTKEVIQL